MYNEKILIGLFCGISCINVQAKDSLDKSPNIIVILTDDLGYGDLSCQEGTKDVFTPNIDKLLNEGVRFRNLYSNSPVSSPSRAALLSGRYPDMVGVPGLIRSVKKNSFGYLSEDALLLPSVLKKKNYNTGIVGKWNLGIDSPNQPNDRGFDYFHGFLDDMMDDYYTHKRHGYNFMRENKDTVNVYGHATEIFTDWAIDFIKDNNNRPFFLYLAYNAPHDPIQPPKEWYEKVKGRSQTMSEERIKLVALIEHLDFNIGRIYEYLEKENKLDNTIIIFTSDNGGDKDFAANNGYFRGEKTNMFEGGIRVPGGIYWKDNIKPAVIDNFVMLCDVYPTLCEMVGISIDNQIDGISILPLLNGEKLVTDNRMVYWVRRDGYKLGGQAYYAARKGKYKILQNTPFEPFEFYNLNKDPFERNPIYDRPKEYWELFNGLCEHIRIAGMIPWQNELYR